MITYPHSTVRDVLGWRLSDLSRSEHYYLVGHHWYSFRSLCEAIAGGLPLDTAIDDATDEPTPCFVYDRPAFDGGPFVADGSTPGAAYVQSWWPVRRWAEAAL